MKRHPNRPIRIAAYCLGLGILAASPLAFGQDSTPPSAPQQNPAPGAWRRVGDPPFAPSISAANSAAVNPSDLQNAAPDQNLPPDAPPPDAPPNAQIGPPSSGIPPQITIPGGTYITVRTNQPLSSDRNQAGDAFTATLVQPIVAQGVVVAQPGQTMGGRVEEAQKAPRGGGTSRLAVQLTTLTLADGQQFPVESQLISWRGPSSVGRSVGTVGATTATGAIIGGAAAGGFGAGIGAAAGVLAGGLGVLLTRGYPTVIPPEAILTFRIQGPVTFSTTQAPQAFQLVQAGEPNAQMQPGPGGPGMPGSPGAPGGPGMSGAPPACAGYNCAPPYPAAPYYGAGYAPYPYPYPYPAYPYPYYGPGFAFYFGPSFYYRGGFYGYRGGLYGARGIGPGFRR
jgi:hypothetical protein